MPVRKPRDSYKGRVYAWEREYIASNSNPRLEFEECVRLIHRVWNDHFPYVRPPLVIKARGYTSRGSRTKISLTKNGYNTWLVLHECAHALSHQFWFMPRSGYRQAHGAEFIRLLINLVARYMRVAAGPLRRSAREVGLPVAPNDSVPQLFKRDRGNLAGLHLAG